MSLIKLLLEASTPILYHFTTDTALLNILKDKKFDTANVLGTSADQKHQRGKFYYLSFQRSGSGKLGYGKFRQDVRIVIDGKTLSNNHKIVPVDYWKQDRMPKKGIPIDRMMRNDEMEDRLITDESSIDNIEKFIMRIDLNAERVDEKIINSLKEINNNIPIFVYKSEKSWINMKKHDAIPLFQYQTESDETAEQRDRYGGRGDADILYLMKIIDGDMYEQTIEDLANDKRYQQLFDQYYADSEKYSNLKDYIIKDVEDNEYEKEYQLRTLWLDQIEDDWRFKEKVSSISNFFHNNKSNSSDMSKKFIQNFVKFMKKNNLKSISDVVKKATKIVQNIREE